MSVTAARDAHARGDWRATYDALVPGRHDLEPADLARLADAAWWLGDSPDSMAVSEELYQRLIAAGSEAEAAHRALRLAMQWFSRGDVQIAVAWLARARRLLVALPRCSLHGYLAYIDGSIDWTSRAIPRPGRGRTAAGFAELDEAMLRCWPVTWTRCGPATSTAR